MSFLRAYPLTFCLALLLALRFGDAHLHLCFDGQEPAATMHVLDTGPEHSPAVSGTHVDENIEMSADGLTKPSKLDIPPLLVAGFLALLLIFARPSVPGPRRVGGTLPSDPAGLRPPSRGPPSISLA